jgi:two-component system C4-dicarboxylate transport sensor histidine kinase DctB
MNSAQAPNCSKIKREDLQNWKPDCLDMKRHHQEKSSDGSPGFNGFSRSFGTNAEPRWRWLVVMAVFLAAATVASYLVAERVAIASLIAATSRQQDLYVANVESEMRRYEYLPNVVGYDPRVRELLAGSSSDAAKLRVDKHLEAVSALTGAAAIYVMDIHGMTLSASNWRQADSFVNMQFAYRPYFQDAVNGRAGRFFGIGTVSREPGYYFANAVRDAGRIVGVTAVKVNLDKLDEKWGRSGEHVVVVDGNGIVFLSSDPQWRFKAIRSLTAETIDRLAATRQYWKPGSLEPLGLTDERDIDSRTAIFSVMPRSSAALQLSGDRYMIHRSSVPGTDWQLFVMADVSPAIATARLSAVLTALTLILVATVLLYMRQRARFVAQSVSARSALQRANDELEQKVRIRTEAVTEANMHLQSEIGERRRAEDMLRSTLQDLVQTAKMAVLGKMSTSITHELNQPLAALQTLSENTSKLLDRSMFDEAKINLDMIARTVARMGLITGQLKKFARRSDVESVPVQLNAVLSDALFLLNQSMRGRNIRLETHIPDCGVWAMCNANRLEQVLVNLISNAADAVEHSGDGVVEVMLGSDDGSVFVEVHDNGPGLDAAATAHLFEPFFTTKAQGVGLGLGLAISSDIVRHFGGSLSADRSERLGGARFVVRLRLAQHHETLA